MEFNVLKRRMGNAISNFLKKEADLLRQNAREESITTQLKIYLEDEFGEWRWNIDHLYDKRIINNEVVQKRITFARDSIPISKIPKTIPPETEVINKLILPDIIFHDRNSNNHNFLVIEVKLSSNKKKDERDFDFLKLETMTSIDLNYEWGIFLDFTSGKEFDHENPFLIRFVRGGQWQ